MVAGRAATAAVLVTVLVAGCGTTSPFSAGGPHTVRGATGALLPSRAAAGGTLTVGMVAGGSSHLDPQNEYDTSTWELFRCCLLRTLMSYDGTGGTSSTVPRPDLAEGPPDVSTDGRTWTFRLRAGLRYGPPLAGVPITTPDVVRAILRSGDYDVFGGSILSNVVGFTEYASGRADSVAGLETPDPLTLRIRLLRPDATLPYNLTLPTTAPIPPSPADPRARFGVATGHDRSAEPGTVDGYGRFLVSSGPYMIEGADAVDFSLPPSQQVPASGLVPWHFDTSGEPTRFGSVSLVRNPSWEPASDPLRAALPDRIVVRGGAEGELFDQLEAGELALVMDATPPARLYQSYLRSASLRRYVHTVDSGGVLLADFNLAQPPFDDVWVRRAVAYALDRRLLTALAGRAYGLGPMTVASHYVPDVFEGALAAGWDPFPGPGGAPDLAAARRAMAHSRYATGGRCAAPACRAVTVLVNGRIGSAVGPVSRSLAALGIRGRVHAVAPEPSFWEACAGPGRHPGMCVGTGWLPDVDIAGNTIKYQFGGPSVGNGSNNTYIGASPARLAALGLPTRVVPNVDAEIRRCSAQEDRARTACWTRLDQYLVTEVIPSVPLAFFKQVVLSTPDVASYSWNTAFQAPALDRLAVAGG